MRNIRAMLRRLWGDEKGSVFVEHILLITIVGLGTLIGLALLRSVLWDEMGQFGESVSQLILP